VQERAANGRRIREKLQVQDRRASLTQISLLTYSVRLGLPERHRVAMQLSHARDKFASHPEDENPM